jgi:hypothetical protein
LRRSSKSRPKYFSRTTGWIAGSSANDLLNVLNGNPWQRFVAEQLRVAFFQKRQQQNVITI